VWKRYLLSKSRSFARPYGSQTRDYRHPDVGEHDREPAAHRAEASDIANAIWDGTDAVMLSAESAAGKYPLEAVQWLAKIADDADQNTRFKVGGFIDNLPEVVTTRTDVAVAFAACRVAEELKAKLLVVFTEGGGSARMVSRLAGSVPVWAPLQTSAMLAV